MGFEPRENLHLRAARLIEYELLDSLLNELLKWDLNKRAKRTFIHLWIMDAKYIY